MSAIRFNLIFEGNIEPGHNPDDVRRELESLFEFDTTVKGTLFSGQPIVMGESMDADTANVFRQALAGTGATTRLEAANDPLTDESLPERRLAQRRLHATRRTHARPGAIQPDRRDGAIRRR